MSSSLSRSDIKSILNKNYGKDHQANDTAFDDFTRMVSKIEKALETTEKHGDEEKTRRRGLQADFNKMDKELKDLKKKRDKERKDSDDKIHKLETDVTGKREENRRYLEKWQECREKLKTAEEEIPKYKKEITSLRTKVDNERNEKSKVFTNLNRTKNQMTKMEEDLNESKGKIKREQDKFLQSELRLAEMEGSISTYLEANGELKQKLEQEQQKNRKLEQEKSLIHDQLNNQHAAYLKAEKERGSS